MHANGDVMILQSWQQLTCRQVLVVLRLHVTDKYYCYHYNHFMALCPGLPGWAGTRRSIHPLIYPDKYPTFISLFHLLRPTASFLFDLHALQSFLHNLSPSRLWSTSLSGALHLHTHQCLLFATHAHTHITDEYLSSNTYLNFTSVNTSHFYGLGKGY